MKNCDNQLFQLPQSGRISEKTIVKRLIITVVTILVCLAATCISAYAYFSQEIISDSNIIKSADFTVNISIKDKLLKPVTATTTDNKTYKATLTAGELYTVTVSPASNNTVKNGFIIVESSNCKEVYHTQQLKFDGNAAEGTLTFKVMVTVDAVVVFRTHWGTSTKYAAYESKGEGDGLYIVQDSEIKMVINGVKQPKATATLPASTLAPTATPDVTATPTLTPTPTPEATATPAPTPQVTVTPTPTATDAVEEQYSEDSEEIFEATE